MASITTKDPVSAPAKKIRSKKAITLNLDIYQTLQKRKSELTLLLGGRVSYNMVIQALLNDHIDLENVRREMEEIRKEAEETQEYIKEILKLAVSSPSLISTPMTIPTSLPHLNPPFNPPPAPVPVSPITNSSPPKILPLTNYNAPNTKDLKSDYQKEIKAIFSGNIMKPSEILNITQPKHKDTAVKFLDKEANIPDVENISITSKRKEYFTAPPPSNADSLNSPKNITQQQDITPNKDAPKSL